MTELWRVAVRVPAAREDDVAALLEPAAVSLNIDFADGDLLEIVAFCDGRPDESFLALIETVAGIAPDVAAANDDWIAQTSRTTGAGRVGGFTLTDAPSAETRLLLNRKLHVVAPLAFGDGYHATTQGCLLALDLLRPQINPARIADIGCGTGVLALAAHKIWPQATIMAGDIDPVSVVASKANAAQNAGRAIRIGQGAGFGSVTGTFDLILMNILAGPLQRLAHEAAARLAPGGRLVLSGMLVGQAAMVLAAYRRQRLALVRQSVQDGWTTLILRKRA